MTTDGGKTWALNVIPTEAEAGFDVRIPPTVPLDEFEARMKEWTKEEGVHYEFVVKTPQHSVTSVDPAENEWWRVFSETTQKLGLGIETEIFPAGGHPGVWLLAHQPDPHPAARSQRIPLRQGVCRRRADLHVPHRRSRWPLTYRRASSHHQVGWKLFTVMKKMYALRGGSAR
ncbi:Aminoacylase [Acanthamoeba castellanii str. Neff]|uniref:Aminoacylase n=1 Tax=Acanthamoeba castellanii (strain ATCC 30010 / Neff) TaxID=1257118 RepID=L8GHG6_ACACF|nr:Aminoacylase [Acanthamoeba castellanii str. Neff]ELR12525.1 Aminoacylase [Acanthamoeba castellanii str. Neff]